MSRRHSSRGRIMHGTRPHLQRGGGGDVCAADGDARERVDARGQVEHGHLMCGWVWEGGCECVHDSERKVQGTKRHSF